MRLVPGHEEKAAAAVAAQREPQDGVVVDGARALLRQARGHVGQLRPEGGEERVLAAQFGVTGAEDPRLADGCVEVVAEAGQVVGVAGGVGLLQVPCSPAGFVPPAYM